MNHGVYVTERESSITTPNVAESGIPFVVGTAPIQSAANPAAVGVPVACTSWADFVDKFGYSDNWKSYTLCEFAYSHFRLYAQQPAIFVNALDPKTAKTAVEAADIDVKEKKVVLPFEAINDSTLVVKPVGGESEPHTIDKDYAVYYTEDGLAVEVLESGGAKEASGLNITYNKVTPESVKAANIATALEAVDLCVAKVGIVPDLIVAPGFSNDAEVAAVMAAKASGINGMFKAKALVDLDTGASGAKTYSTAIEKAKALNDGAQIVCWPMVTQGGKKYHFSTHLAGVIANTDASNAGVPYESTDNKAIVIDGLVLDDGTEVNLTLNEANMLNANGIVTAINFLTGWVAWGSYTACYPESGDVKDIWIPISRMFGWVSNTLIGTFWEFVGRPMTRRLADNVIDTANIWLNGLVGAGYLYGARIEMNADENPETDLARGIIKFHIYMTPPAPAQEIDFTLEYDASYVAEALMA